MKVIESFKEKDTYSIGKSIAESAKSGDVYCLKGDLGVGKTVFTKGFAEGLGIKEEVTSPTFTIVNEYTEGRIALYHFDCYRISSSDEMIEIGLDEYISGSGVCLMEWAENIEDILPEDAIWITIEKDYSKSDDYRRISIK